MANMQTWRALGLALCAGLPLLTTGCATNTGRGALAGGGLGAGAGALVGSLAGKAGKGAAIGGAIGATMGALAGNDVDHQEKRQNEARVVAAEQAAYSQNVLSLEDIARLAQSGTSDTIIISQIRQSGASYPRLSAEQITWLKQNNVSDNVILEMQRTMSRPVAIARPAPVVVHEPPPVIVHRPAPVVVVERPLLAPPPPSLSLSYTRVGR
jgi:outer membrane lipoprotein SlyB